MKKPQNKEKTTFNTFQKIDEKPNFWLLPIKN
jgi:hypothetical protein